MKFKKRFLMVFMSLTLLVGMMGGGGVAAADESTQPSGGVAFVVVNGNQIVAKEGTVVATATPIPGSNSCKLPNIRVIGGGDANIAFVSIRLLVTEDYQVVVDKVIFDTVAHPEPSRPKGAIPQDPRLNSAVDLSEIT
ncbi:hypothetical protein Dehly_1544 [Dehalogenimonas lykanthroporepellens BL-DC-9]|nr:hypothetical protein Dehly_1544 [Dehalogenimonas lykanthroporepellens BL-DC-9]